MVDSQDIVIKAQIRDQDEQFRQAFQEAFQNNVGDRYMTWKYWENPWGSNHNYVALHGKRLIGALGCILKKLQVNGREITAAQEMDMFVVKEYRRHGTYFKLFRHRLVVTPQTGAAFSFGVTSAFLRELSVRLFKYTNIGEIPHLCKVIIPHLYTEKRFGKGLLVKTLGHICDLVSGSYDRVVSARQPTGNRIEVYEIDAFEEEYDNFWAEVSKEIDIAVMRDSNYMNWRYFQNPDTKFTILAARHDDKLASVLITTNIELETRKALVMEFLYLPGEERSGNTLLSEAVRRWKRDRIETAWCWMSRRSHGYRLLRRFGFIPRKREIYLTVRTVTEDVPMSSLVDLDRWYLTLGDTDFFFGRQI